MKNSTDSYIGVGVKNGFQNQFWMVQIFLFLTIFMWETKKIAPSEAVPSLLDGMNTKSYMFFLSIFP